MIHLHIHISKKRVYTDISLESEYQASKYLDDKGKPSAQGELAVYEEDYPRLDLYWDTACQNINELMMPFVVDTTEHIADYPHSSEDYSILIELPDCSSPVLLRLSLHSYLINRILEDWYRQMPSNPNALALASSHNAKADGLLKQAKVILYKRLPPSKAKAVANKP